jgi:hypothetical protein
MKYSKAHKIIIDKGSQDFIRKNLCKCLNYFNDIVGVGGIGGILI